MKYRRVGRSGLKVSEIGLGTWLTFDGTNSQVTEDKAINTIQHAFNNGINYFDTANFYGKGQAEKTLGKGVKDIPRDELVIASKVYFPVGRHANAKGLSRKHIVEQCEKSLQNLGMEYLDIYMCHRYDDDTPLEESLWAMDDLVTKGKVLYAGISEWLPNEIEEGMSVAKQNRFRPIISNQYLYNMFTRNVENTTLKVNDKHGIGNLIFSPLAQGLLTNHTVQARQTFRERDQILDDSVKYYKKPELWETLDLLKDVADKKGVTLSQLAIAWILRLSSITSVVMGADSPEQIDENIAASNLHLIDSEWGEINNIIEKSQIEFPLIK